MLKRFRIEVEEVSPAECVEALDRYEHALHQQEARRYRWQWPVTLGSIDDDPGKPKNADPAEEYPTPDQPWAESERLYYEDWLGREVTEEVIEYDPALPGYKGRRVVSFKRIDTRRDSMPLISVEPYFTFETSGFQYGGTTQNSGVNPVGVTSIRSKD